MAGCVASTIGVLITMVVIGVILQSAGASNEFDLPILLGLLVSVLVFNVLGRTLVRLLFRSRLRFFRAYQRR